MAWTRSTSFLRGTYWRPSVCDAAFPLDRWRRGDVGCPSEVYTAQLRQAVEKLRLELASLVGGDCLWAAKTRYPARQQNT